MHVFSFPRTVLRLSSPPCLLLMLLAIARRNAGPCRAPVVAKAVSSVSRIGRLTIGCSEDTSEVHHVPTPHLLPTTQYRLMCRAECLVILLHPTRLVHFKHGAGAEMRMVLKSTSTFTRRWLRWSKRKDKDDAPQRRSQPQLFDPTMACVEAPASPILIPVILLAIQLNLQPEVCHPSYVIGLSRRGSQPTTSPFSEWSICFSSLLIMILTSSISAVATRQTCQD